MSNYLEDANEIIKARLQKLEEIKAMGINPYGQKYEYTHHSSTIIENFEELENQTVKVAGRIMAIRGHGKAAFFDIRDDKGDIQIYIKKDNVTEQDFTLFKKLDLGDIVGIEGKVFKTHKGEISISTEKLTILSKAIKPFRKNGTG